jgi:hypothetical protein
MIDLSILKEEAEASSETLLPVYRTTWRYIPRGTNLNMHCIENFIYHTFSIISKFILVNIYSGTHERIIAVYMGVKNHGLY